MFENIDDCKCIQIYFRKHLERLQDAQSKGRFIQILNNPRRLELRLRELEPKLTESILAEVGHNTDINQLDNRLVNAWAEIRVASQLQKEGFTKIKKTRDVVDFTARLFGKDYAIQVTRINRSFSDTMIKHNPNDMIDDEPFGDIQNIYARFNKPLNCLFWGTLQDKNGDFRKWERSGFIRCVAIVSSEDVLQDAFVRHIACREIHRCIHALSQRHFEELIWLPDLSNGAWFKIGETPKETICLTDWCENSALDECENSINRKQANLNSLLPK